MPENRSAIAEDETGGSLYDKLAESAQSSVLRPCKALEDKTATFIKQDNEASTHTKMIDKKLGDIDWNKPAGRLNV